MTMKHRIHILAVVVALALPLSLFAQSSQPAPVRKAVVVELFTSEGCSTCPPADNLLIKLRQTRANEGFEIIPLGLHVDYWNHQGWNDRFSSSAYTERQIKYAGKLHVKDPYTPQLVVDGATQFVGNDAERLVQAIREAGRKPQTADVQITGDDHQLQITVKAAPDSSGDVMLAVAEDNLSSKVSAGENNKKELYHAAVVRELKSLGKLHNGSFTGSTSINIKKDWKRDDLRIVVFVQEPNTGPIDGAASLMLSVKSTASSNPNSQQAH
jgi:hypothetical protein